MTRTLIFDGVAELYDATFRTKPWPQPGSREWLVMDVLWYSMVGYAGEAAANGMWLKAEEATK